MISFPIWEKFLQHKAFAPDLNSKFSISWLLSLAQEDFAFSFPNT